VLIQGFPYLFFLHGPLQVGFGASWSATLWNETRALLLAADASECRNKGHRLFAPFVSGRQQFLYTDPAGPLPDFTDSLDSFVDLFLPQFRLRQMSLGFRTFNFTHIGQSIS